MFSAYPIRLSWLWECVLYLIIIIKSEVWIVNHCLGLGHETMVCAVCLTIIIFLSSSSYHHLHHHHHHYCSLYLRNDQKIWITTKIHIFTKGFKHIECGCFLRDHAGFNEHNEPRVVLYKLWHDIINSHKVTKHACTFTWLPLATQYTTYTITLQ